MKRASRLRPTVPDVARTLAEWEAVAPSFARSRPAPWPQVVRWAERTLPPPARVLDLAAGNGRHGAALAPGRDVVACDFAQAMVEASRARGLASARAEVGHLPFRDGAFDGAVFVAALHNVPGQQNRLAALAELARVLRPGGRALVTVWSRWRAGWVRHFLAEMPHHAIGDAHGAFGDTLVPWETDGGVVARYYHFYSRPELRADCEAVGLRVERLWGERLAIPRGAPRPVRWLADNLFVDVAKR